MWLRRPERPSVEPIRVTLFRKQGCGLCDQAEAMLARISKQTPLRVTAVDIDSDEDLQRRYFMEIPVVAVDVPFQIWEHHRQLRMTKEEVRQEYKETEGDPQLKARIRQLQREQARRRMMAEVPKADVVVTNPTHFAVALRYREGSMRAPMVVAKGSDKVAERIIELARDNAVPVLRAAPLARALHAHGDLGREIPAALYTAVAEVLAYVYQLTRYERSGGDEPVAPTAIAVPPELDPAIGGDEA